MKRPRLPRSAPGWKRWLITRWLCAALVAAICLLALGHSTAAAPRRALDQYCGTQQPFAILQTATAANSVYDYTAIDNAITNDCPQAGVVVTATYTPGAVYDNHVLGVWYTGTKWAIFHEDGTPIPLGATYNVLMYAYASYGNDSPMRIVTATTFNTSFGMLATGDTNPNYPPMVTSTWNPEGVGGVSDTHLLGDWYASGQWYIFHEDGTPSRMQPPTMSGSLVLPTRSRRPQRPTAIRTIP